MCWLHTDPGNNSASCPRASFRSFGCLAGVSNPSYHQGRPMFWWRLNLSLDFPCFSNAARIQLMHWGQEPERTEWSAPCPVSVVVEEVGGTRSCAACSRACARLELPHNHEFHPWTLNRAQSGTTSKFVQRKCVKFPKHSIARDTITFASVSQALQSSTSVCMDGLLCLTPCASCNWRPTTILPRCCSQSLALAPKRPCP